MKIYYIKLLVISMVIHFSSCTGDQPTLITNSDKVDFALIGVDSEGTQSENTQLEDGISNTATQTSTSENITPIDDLNDDLIPAILPVINPETETETETNINTTTSTSTDSSTNTNTDDSLPVDELTIAQLYAQQCSACHGDTAEGPFPITSEFDGDMVNLIDQTMPVSNPSDCDFDCATQLTNWMAITWNQEVEVTLPVEVMPPESEPENDDVQTAQLYSQQCSACHGDDGNGVYPITSEVDDSAINLIDQTMPVGNPSSCDFDCATALAMWMNETWNLIEDDTNVVAPVELPDEPETVNEDGSALSGGQLYAQQCESCHGENGNGNVPITGTLQRSDLVNYIVTTMPYGAPSTCDVECSQDIVSWMFDNFENASSATEVTPLETDIDVLTGQLNENNAQALLHRISLNLVGRLPNSDEISQINNNGSQALDSVVDDLLDDNAFVERIKDVFNDLLLTQQWDQKDGFHSYLRNYSWNSFEDGDTEWVKDFKGIDYYTTIRRYTSNGHSRSPLELVGYIIKNDRPFSEILTADYAMLNWYAAKSFNLESTATFSDLPLDEQLNQDFPKDPNDFQPIYLPNVPSAGVLTTGVYMLKYRTTDSNQNRNRAYMFYKQFLDTDIFAIGGERPGDSDSSHEVPTLTDPNCIACHNVMDPVASSFKHWISFAGMGRPFYDPAPSTNEWDSSEILQAGFNGIATPDDQAPLPWLAKQAVQDSRFARSMVKAVFKPLTGVDLIPPTSDGVTFQSTAYLEQQAFIAQISEQFMQNDFDFKEMAKALVLSAYTIGDHSSELSDLMLTPDQLNLKINSTLGLQWDNWLSTWNVLYGGIDSEDVTVRNQAPNGASISIQLRMAEDMACEVTALEFSKLPQDRLMLGNTEPDILPTNEANKDIIKLAIVDVYEQLLGQRFAVDDITIVTSFEVYESALSIGQAGIANGTIDDWLPTACKISSSNAAVNSQYVNKDQDYYTRAWQAVIQFALMDPRYFYL